MAKIPPQHDGKLVHTIAHSLPAIGCEARGLSGRVGVNVRDKIRNAHVRLMAHAADDRHGHRGHGTGKLLIVERPQIFRAAAAANEQHGVNAERFSVR